MIDLQSPPRPRPHRSAQGGMRRLPAQGGMLRLLTVLLAVALLGLVAPGAAAAAPAAAAQQIAAVAPVSSSPVSTSVVTTTVGDPVATYVTAVYRDLFGRSVDAGGLATWTIALKSGTPRVAVANAITYSAEYRRGLITGSYQKYLGRSPDAAGLTSWLAAMQRGMTIQQMERGFVASSEYYARAGGTPRAWVAKLYQNVLGRAAAESEITYWVGVLSGGTSRSAIATGFLMSAEHLGAVVNEHYGKLLGRKIDVDGRSTWVRAIQSGTRVEAVIGSIVGSAEYVNRNGGASIPPPQKAPASAPGTPPAALSAPVPAPAPDAQPEPVTDAQRPSAATTGVPAGMPLTVHHGDLTITTPGTVIDGLDIHGFVTIKAADVTIRNSVVRGSGRGSFNTGLVNCTHHAVRNALIEDVTLVPATPSVWINGVLGHDYTARRVNVYHVVDGFGVYNTHGPAANVRIESSYVHDLAYFSTDPNHADNRTHNDAIQIQGGTNIQIIGNYLSAYLATGAGTQDYRFPQAGFGVILTPNVSVVSGSVIDGNWIDGSYIPVKLTTGTKGATDFGRVTGNRFARDMRNTPMNGVNQWFTILTSPDLTGQFTGNVYDDDGSPVTVRHDSGTSTAP